MAADGNHSPDGIRLVEDGLWEQLKLPRSAVGRLDPGLRSVLALLFEPVGDDRKDWYQIEQRAGIRWDPAKGSVAQYLPLLVEYDWARIRSRGDGPALEWLRKLGLDVAPSYFSGKDLPRHSTARIAVRADRPERLFRLDGGLLDKLSELLALDGGSLRLELPGAAQPLGVESIEDIGLPSRGGAREPGPDGTGVIVGIIDDGCAFAHPNFIRDVNGTRQSRVLCLWDQGKDAIAGAASGTPQQPSGFQYGRELTRTMIDAALAKHTRNGIVDEDAVYGELDYEIELASHGTQVMDIAAGNGSALTSTPGIAPNADLIFVQLPSAARDSGGALLDKAIEDGVRYIFERAGETPVVINISYGGHLGPHNGESAVETRIDQEIAAQPGRAVVVAAGNGFAADCHAGGNLPPRRGRNLRWIVKPEDPSANTLEVWYDAGAQLEVTLTTPDGSVLNPVALGVPGQNLKAAGRLLGTVDHQQAATPTGLNRIRITLNPTGSLPPGATTPLAPSGTWHLRLRNVGNVRARWDAWIERDTAGRPGGARRMQSHFHPDDADPRCTLGSYATGKLTIAAGGYNTATQEVCRYSACGPTRDGRQKPEVMAPAEEDAAGRGVLSASARSAAPRRMNGTSAAAPQVAGIVALLFQAAGSAPPNAAAIRQHLCNSAAMARPQHRLLPNAHVNADDRRKVKQGKATIWPHLSGEGKVRWP
jgi:subtilisin family serine protease